MQKPDQIAEEAAPAETPYDQIRANLRKLAEHTEDVAPDFQLRFFELIDAIGVQLRSIEGREAQMAAAHAEEIARLEEHIEQLRQMNVMLYEGGEANIRALEYAHEKQLQPLLADQRLLWTIGLRNSIGIHPMPTREDLQRCMEESTAPVERYLGQRINPSTVLSAGEETKK